MDPRRFPFRRSCFRLSQLVVVATTGVFALFVGESAVLASTITVKASDCQRLVRHQPSADVAYQPGVDVNGNAVAPADLPGSVTIKTPTDVTFNVTYDLLSNYGVSSDTVLAPRGEAVVGEVKYDLLSGALSFDGDRLDDAETAALRELCKAAETQ